MDIKSLEKDELVDLTAMLGARLAKAVENELMAEIRARRLEIRAKKLEQALDGYRKEVFWENRAKQLSAEIQGWQDKAALAEEQTEAWEKRAQELSKELKAAKAQWEEGRKTLQSVLESRDQAMLERDQAKQRTESLAALNTTLASDHLKASAEWKTEREIFSASIRRLERELRETKANMDMVKAQRDNALRNTESIRAKVMDEVSAMIPKAVEAEREACAAIARGEALRCAQSAPANILMDIVNKIKTRTA